MERYKNFVRMEEIRNLLAEEDYDRALEIAVTIDITKLKKSSEINLLYDIYMRTGEYEHARDCMLLLYGKARTRRILSQLVEVSLKLHDDTAADKYYEEFIKLAPDDYYRYIFRYSIDKMQGKPFATLIATLEELKNNEYIDSWAYELAKLYHKAGLRDKCIKECDDILVWFGEGDIVERAKALKAYYLGEIAIENEEEEHSDEMTEVISDEAPADSEAYESDEDMTIVPEPSEDTTPEIQEEVEVQEETEVSEDVVSEFEEEVVAEISDEIEVQEETEVSEDIASELEKEVVSEVSDEVEVQEETEVSEDVASELEKEVVPEVQEEVNVQNETEISEEECEKEEQIIEESLASFVNSIFEEVKDTFEVPTEVAENIAQEFSDDSSPKEEGEAEEVATEECTTEETEENDAEEISTYDMDSRFGSPVLPDENSLLAKLLKGCECSITDFFEGYIFIDSIRTQIYKCLEVLLNSQYKNRSLIISGVDTRERTSIARGIIKILYLADVLKEQKIARTTGEKVNNIDITKKNDRIAACGLLIENAGGIDGTTADRLLKFRDIYGSNTMIILQDTKNEINRIFHEFSNLASVFTNRIHIQKLGSDELFSLALWELHLHDLKIEESAAASLKSRIDTACQKYEDDAVSVVLDMVGEIVDTVETRNARAFIAGTMSGSEQIKNNQLVKDTDINN